MVRWNAGTDHVKTQRQTLSPAGPKIEIQKGFTPWNPFIRQGCCWHWMASTRGLAHPFGGMAPTMSIAKSAGVRLPVQARSSVDANALVDDDAFHMDE